MCFYYSITKKSANTLIKSKIIKEEQLSLFQEYKVIINGFDHPRMPVITAEKPGEIQYMQWGFLPSKVNSADHAKEFLGQYNTLNAKAEGVESSKLYSESFQNRRCLVLCTGFFEWRKVKKEKVPYFISLKNDEMFVFAGLWNRTINASGQPIDNYAIVTIEANELMATIHNEKKRMPLILSPDDAAKWLSSDLKTDELQPLIKPISSESMKAHTIKKFLPANAKNINTDDVIAYYNYPDIPDIMGAKDTLF